MDRFAIENWQWNDWLMVVLCLGVIVITFLKEYLQQKDADAEASKETEKRD